MTIEADGAPMIVRSLVHGPHTYGFHPPRREVAMTAVSGSRLRVAWPPSLPDGRPGEEEQTMLSDRERQKLAQIEQDLIDDRRLADALSDHALRHRSRWLPAAVAGFGIVVLVLGLFCADGPLVLQGMAVAGVGFGWRWWRARRASARSPGRASGPSPARPAGHPPL